MNRKAQQLDIQKIFWIMAAMVFVLFVAYAYFLDMAILNVVDRQKAEKQVTNLSAVTGRLETEYLSVKDNINLELAYSMGFKESNNTKFISRASGGSLTFNTR